MSREIVRQEIAQLLETITEQVETINSHEKKIPQIELDIILSNVRDLYEELIALNKTNSKLDGKQSLQPKENIVNKISVSDLITAAIVDVTPAKQEVKQVSPAPAPAEGKITEPANRENIEEKIEIIAANKIEEKIVATPQIIIEEQPQQEITEKKIAIVTSENTSTQHDIAPQTAPPNLSQKEVVEEKTEIVAANKEGEAPVKIASVVKPSEAQKPAVSEETKTNTQEEVVVKAAVADVKYESRKPNKTAASLFDAAPSIAAQFNDAHTLKEKLTSSNTGKSVADKIHHQKIEDLKKAIGINEKFLFINELFEGSLASYNEHIEKINTSSSVDHARSIVDSLITKYNWDSEKEIVKKMMDLVERRFA